MPLLSTLVSTVFCLVLLQQYRERRKPYQLTWCIAMAMFALATASEFLGAAGGWTPLLVRSYYLFGATLVVGYLAQGTMFLSASPKTARVSLAVLLVLTALALVGVATAPVDTAALAEGYRAMTRPPLLRGIAMTLNILGTLIIVGGALTSAYTFLRRRAMPQRAAANLLIALGTLIVASGGTLTGQLGFPPTAITVANLIGVTVMFIGTLQASRQPRSATASA